MPYATISGLGEYRRRPERFALGHPGCLDRLACASQRQHTSAFFGDLVLIGFSCLHAVAAGHLPLISVTQRPGGLVPSLSSLYEEEPGAPPGSLRGRCLMRLLLEYACCTYSDYYRAVCQ